METELYWQCPLLTVRYREDGGSIAIVYAVLIFLPSLKVFGFSEQSNQSLSQLLNLFNEKRPVIFILGSILLLDV